jgi:prepilin-type N-terminal cleavage/methylation domain-containing protein
MNKLAIKNNSGFTLVEMLVAISIFTIVIVFGISALLNVNKVHKSNQKMRQLIDTIDFAVEDMSRNIRLGYDYYCIITPDPNQGIASYFNSLTSISIANFHNDCFGQLMAPKKALIFEGMNGTFPDYINNTSAIDRALGDQIVYKFEKVSGQDYYTLKKSIDGGSSFANMATSEIRLNSKSGFLVAGSAGTGEDYENADYMQPRVLIRLSGEIVYKDVIVPFDIQTTVTQRFLDN